jgi:hypothetical protein
MPILTSQTMFGKKPPAAVVVHPRAFTEPVEDELGVSVLMDVVSIHLYSCVSRCAPDNAQDLMRAHLTRLLNDLNKSPYAS